MKIIEYKTKNELREKAVGIDFYEIIETSTSFSFRVFVNKNCIEIHIYYK